METSRSVQQRERRSRAGTTTDNQATMLLPSIVFIPLAEPCRAGTQPASAGQRCVLTRSAVPHYSPLSSLV